ncbi:hypothetical protein ACUY2P_03725, partial [Corynebacterium hadale]
MPDFGPGAVDLNKLVEQKEAQQQLKDVMSRDFLDEESRKFLDRMSNGFLDTYSGGISGWLFHCTSAEK